MKTVVITIAYEVPAERVSKIQAFLANVALRDVDFNGIVFEVERGDYTSFDSASPYGLQNDMRLLSEVQAIASGEDEVSP